MMISNHYPMMFGHPGSPFIALGIVVAGGLIRHFFNITNHGVVTAAAIASIPAAVIVVVVLILITAYRPGAGPMAGGHVTFADIHPIVSKHCLECHSAKPTNSDFPQAPKGVMFDTPEEIRTHAARIEQQAVLSKVMPLGNLTGNDGGRTEKAGRLG